MSNKNKSSQQQIDFNQEIIEMNMAQNLKIQIAVDLNQSQAFQIKINQRNLSLFASCLLKNKMINKFKGSLSINQFQNYARKHIINWLQTNSQKQRQVVQMQGNRLLGGGCGQSRNQLDQITNIVVKANENSQLKSRTTFKIDNNFLEEYNQHKQQCQEIIKNMQNTTQKLTFNTIQFDEEEKEKSQKEDQKDIKSVKTDKNGANRRSSLLHIPEDHFNDRQQRSMSKFSLYKKKEGESENEDESEESEEGRDTQNNQEQEQANNETKKIKSSKKDSKKNQQENKQQKDQQQKQLSDIDDNDDDIQETEEYNLRATIFQLEEFIYKYRKNLGDDIEKYKYYYLDIFEIYLKFSFLSSNQSSCDATDLINQQKEKIKEMRKIVENQKENQPALDLVFYLHLFEEVRETDFVFRQSKSLNRLMNSCKYLVSKIQSAAEIANKMSKGYLVTGIGELIQYYNAIIQDIDSASQKNFFKLLFNISIHDMKANSRQTGNKTLNTSKQIVFYISKFKELYQENKIQEEKQLLTYFLLKISFLIENLLDIHHKIQQEKNQFLIQNKIGEFQQQTHNLHTDEVNHFITILTQYVRNDSLIDKIKQIVNLSISDIYFKYANLKLQITFRKLLIANQQESDPIYKLIKMSLFKQYIEEKDDSVKILLYTDPSFQQFVNHKKKKNPSSKDTLVCNKEFIQEFIEMNQNWKPQSQDDSIHETISKDIKAMTKSIYSALKSNSSYIDKKLSQKLKLV
ncbi:hypothetical protein ABPG72_022393 [Tetrahymena utriculariae]